MDLGWLHSEIDRGIEICGLPPSEAAVITEDSDEKDDAMLDGVCLPCVPDSTCIPDAPTHATPSPTIKSAALITAPKALESEARVSSPDDSLGWLAIALVIAILALLANKALSDE